jgi:hypothetical protein
MKQRNLLDLLKPAFTVFTKVETQRTIILDFWYLGLLQWMLYAAAVTYVFLSFYSGHTWASHEVVEGNVNSYAALNSRYTAAGKDFLAGTKVPAYCNNPNYRHASSIDSFWHFEPSDCEVLDWQEVVMKDPLGAVYVSTTFIEEVIHGYPCSSGPTSAAASKCTEAGSGYPVPGTIDTMGNQCTCRSKRTVTPIAPEELTLGFGHGYVGVAFNGIEGSHSLENGGYYNTMSEDPLPLGGALNTRILYANYSNTLSAWDQGADPTTYREYPGGMTIQSMSIKEWLEAGGAQLDVENLSIRPDYRNDSQRVTNRYAGAMIDIDIAYSNTDDAGRPQTSSPIHVQAVIRVKSNTQTFRGPGPQVIWPEYPSGPSTEQTYHKVTRYHQGVVVNFRSVHSKIYAFDPIFLVNALCNALVIMGLAPLVVRFVALYMIPFGVSKSLEKHICQTISEDGVALEEDEEQGGARGASGSGTVAPAQPSQAPPVQAAAPPVQVQLPVLQMQNPTGVFRVICARCKGVFGCHTGTVMVRCPHCSTTQAVPQGM